MAAPLQVPLEGMPLGRMSPQAVLNLREVELASRLGLSFEDGEDDLDRFRGAGVRLPDEIAAILVHRGNPNGKAQVYLADAPGYLEGAPGTEEDARRRIDATLAFLGLAGAEVWWRRGEAFPDIASA